MFAVFFLLFMFAVFFLLLMLVLFCLLPLATCMLMLVLLLLYYLTPRDIAIGPALVRIGGVTPGTIRVTIRIAAIVVTAETETGEVRGSIGMLMRRLRIPGLTGKVANRLGVVSTIGDLISSATALCDIAKLPRHTGISRVAPGTSLAIRIAAVVVTAQSFARGVGRSVGRVSVWRLQIPSLTGAVRFSSSHESSIVGKIVFHFTACRGEGFQRAVIAVWNITIIPSLICKKGRKKSHE
jgi:hypothetical protein